MLYLIEGLDCSGKKTVAAYVKKRLNEDGVEAEIHIGSVGSRIVSWLSNILVHDYSIVKGSYKDRFRKWLYCMEPIIDHLFYRDNSRVIIKVSSHYRFFSRAYVENDRRVISFYKKNRSRMIRYDGITLINADFEDRIKRHRSDYAKGKTDKIESKRFFDNDSSFFSKWEKVLERMIRVRPINSSSLTIREMGDIICADIERLLEAR